METRELIILEDFCKSHNIPVSFFDSLDEYQLVEIVRVKKKNYITSDQLAKVEKIRRLHYDMAVNFEGIDIITNMLSDMEKMQEEIHQLRNRISFFEV